MTYDSPERGQTHEVLSFLIGNQEFCIDIMAVREIKGWTATTPLSHAPAFVQGVINLRGTVLPIVDLAERLCLGSTEPTPQHVIIVAQIGHQVMGLLVTAVCDTLTVNDDAIHSPPELGSAATRSTIQGLIMIDDRMISLLRTDRLLPEIVASAVPEMVDVE
jgi:purine-binding chemotaxis protein CheW